MRLSSRLTQAWPGPTTWCRSTRCTAAVIFPVRRNCNVALISGSMCLEPGARPRQYFTIPGYQSVLKDLKTSTRQRFIAIDFGYPDEDQESDIIFHESKVGKDIAAQLAMLGARIRNLRHHGFDEGISTRLLVYAGQLITRGVNPIRACDAAICRAVSDDVEVQRAIGEVVSTIFPSA